jgi:Cyclic nucleotide-binding domain
MRVESAATALSWIPSEAVTGLTRAAFTVGLTHYDQPPAGTLGDLAELRAADRFRFANRLAAWAEFDGDTLVGYGQDGGGLMGSTTVRIAALGTTFAAVGMPDLRPEPEVGPGWARFTQTCGGRTAVPAPRRINRPPFVRLRAPLVWTTVSITLHADGRSEVGLAGASPFPRHWVYGADGELLLKAGMTDFAGWMSQPSQRNTPWGDEDSPVVVTAAETALERELSGLLMRGATRPTIRVLRDGAVLAAQGEPGDSLYLLLDGVLRVSVDGEALAEIGPGAVLGERALLEGGTRTATLTAVTPIRVAEAPASALDLVALAELSQGHRREATATAAGAAAPVQR